MAMTNYIDGDALVREMLAMRKFEAANDYDRGWEDALTEVCVAIDSVHGVKLPEMVQHGEWQKKHIIGDSDFWVCPICGTYAPTAHASHYCSECGARLEVPDNG